MLERGVMIKEETDADEHLFRSSEDKRVGWISGITAFDVKQVEYAAVDGMGIFEGDIALGPVAMLEDRRTALEHSVDTERITASGLAQRMPEIVHGIGIPDERFRWPGGLIPYEMETALRQVVTDAIAHWQERTHFRFVERTPANEAQYPNYISFRSLSGCWSFVGMQGGRQEISLGAGCGFGAAVHEIGHAVGLWHEQSREDRDRFVRINWANITPGREHNFNQHITDGDDIGGYDFASIMHYGPTAFSRNGLPTIEPLGGQNIGQRNGLSEGDVAAIKAMYPGLERKHSGFFIQGSHGVRGNFEVVTPRTSGGLVHYWRNNDVSHLPWAGPHPFGRGQVHAVSMIQGNFGSPGNLEVVAREGNQLVFYWRMGRAPWTWNGPFAISGASGVQGNPALIQGYHGTKGNFELVVPRASGGLAHFWRNNDLPHLPWSGPFAFGSGNVSAVCLLQSNFGHPGNLEVVARVGDQLMFYWRLGRPPWTWNGPFPIPGGSGVTGTPAMIQSYHGVNGNFELVVPRLSGGLAHYWRNNDVTGLPWSGPTNFGSGSISTVSLIQSNFGTPGNLEVIAQESHRVAHYWRLGRSPWTWNGPFYFV